MQKLNCFLCHTDYYPEDRKAAAYILRPGEEKLTGVSWLRVGEKTLALCSDCVRAAVFGIALNQSSSENGITWAEEVQFEEDEQEESKEEEPAE